MTDEINLTERPEDTIRRLANENLALRAAVTAKRLEMRPGDRIVCNLTVLRGQSEADEVRDRLRAMLQLPPGIPLIVTDDSADISEQPDYRQLAAEILASFTMTSDGYRARVGQVQLRRWRDQLGSE